MAEDDKKPMEDVSKPGTTPASATSRPIIVSRTAAVSDPMVSTAQPEKTQPPSVSTESSGSMRPRIEPTKAAQAVQKDATNETDAANALAEPIKEPIIDDKQVRLGDIIESGEYNLSIKQKNASSNIKTFLVTVLMIILFFVLILYLLTGLDIVDLGIKLPFQLFK